MLLALLFFLPAAFVPVTAATFEEIAAEARGHVGAAVRVVESGEQISFHGSDHFPMQSVYKFIISRAVIHDGVPLDRQIRVAKSDLVRPGLYSPIRDAHPEGDFDMTVQDLMRYAIAESDGTASDVLLRLAGGPERVTAYVRSLGVQDIVVATSEGEMSRDVQVQYRNWSTPDAMVQLLAKLSPQHDKLILKYMTESTPGAQRIKGLLPPGTVVAHKTGTSGTDSGITRATNDAGLITLPDGRHLAIAVFVSDSPANIETREGVIARIARAAWDRFTAAH